MNPKISMSQLPRSIKPEVKFRDLNGTDNTTATLISNYTMLAPNQGVDGDEFLGQRLHLLSADITWDAEAVSTTQSIRVSVVKAREAALTIPPYTSPTGRYDHNLYAVVHDELYSPTVTKAGRIKVKLNTPMRFNQTGTTPYDGVHWVMINTVGTGGTSMLCVTRLYFTDA